MTAAVASLGGCQVEPVYAIAGELTSAVRRADADDDWDAARCLACDWLFHVSRRSAVLVFRLEAEAIGLLCPYCADAETWRAFRSVLRLVSWTDR